MANSRGHCEATGLNTGLDDDGPKMPTAESYGRDDFEALLDHRPELPAFDLDIKRADDGDRWRSRATPRSR